MEAIEQCMEDPELRRIMEVIEQVSLICKQLEPPEPQWEVTIKTIEHT